MKIMSINAGSSSLKFSLFDMETKEVLTSGQFERIGIEGSFYTIKYQDYKINQECEIKDHSDAVKILLEKIQDLQIIKDLDEIDGVGHRIVHGGALYNKSVLITDKVIDDIVALSDLAPLHNPAHVLGINAFKEALPNVPMVAVFDTAFHQTLEKENFLYPVPYSWYENYQVRKYGFHGTSHKYITRKISEELGNDHLKIISCHLGNGGSVTAIKDGKSINTSMGFTPLAGIMMGTRSGDVDSSIIPYVMEKEGKSAGEVISDLNRKSGLLGVSQYSADNRDIMSAIKEGNEQCALAKRMYVNSVVKYISQYYVQLGGADVICFTAGLGERCRDTRREIVEQLNCLGIKLDLEKNNVSSEFRCISTPDSTVKLYIVPTDEELMIATDTLEIINR